MKLVLFLTLSCIGCALASSSMGAGDHFLGIKELPAGRKLQNFVTDECAKVIAGDVNAGIPAILIEDVRSDMGAPDVEGDPVFMEMEMFVTGDMTICGPDSGLIQKAHFLYKDNMHDEPDLKWDFTNTNLDRAGIDNVRELTATAQNTTVSGGDPQAIWWGAKTQQNSGFNENIKYTYVYQVNTPMVEKLVIDNFYEEGEEIPKNGGYTYTEQKMFLIHTMWLEEDYKQLSRWFEWVMTVRTFMTLTPFDTPKASVYPVEIKVPPCGIDNPTCVMTVHHSGRIMFIEERANVNDTANGWPDSVTYLKDEDIDWQQLRSGYQFASLAQNVLFKIQLKDRSSSRKFILQSLFYNYDSRPPSIPLYDRAKNLEKEQIVNIKWWNDLRELTFQLRFLKIGRVRGLTYQATIKLCKLQGGANDNDSNTCDGLKLSEATEKDAGKDIKPTSARRMLSARYLADADKTVVQQYNTEEIGACSDCVKEEQSYISNGSQPSATSEESTGGGSGMLIVVVLLVLIIIGGGAFGVWYVMNNKKSAGNQGGQAYADNNQA